MDARSNIKGRVPSRHETEDGSRESFNGRGIVAALTDVAVHLLPAVVRESGIKFGASQIFKKTPDNADSHQIGRDVAKDSLEIGGMPLPMIDQGHARRDSITGSCANV